MIEEGSKSSKSMVEKRQLFMEMSELLSELTTFPAQFTTHTHTQRPCRILFTLHCHRAIDWHNLASLAGRQN